MKYLLLDTCIWLKLAKKLQSRPLLKSILANLNQDKLKILLSDVTIEEYNRNKSDIISKYTQSLKNLLKNAKEIQDYLDDSEYFTFQCLLNKANDNIEKSAKEGINALSIVESIFGHRNTIQLLNSDKILIDAAQIALEKQAPCHREKNSVADTIIYLQFESFIKKAKLIEDNIFFCFVTENFQDFSSRKDNRIPHEDLSIFGEENVDYYIDFKKALEKLELEDIPPDEFDLFQSRLQMDRYDSLPCISKDGHLFNDNEGCWSLSPFAVGPSWHLICTRCGALKDTGDFFE